MTSSHACARTLAASLLAFGIGLTAAPTASADPSDANQTQPLPATVGPPAPAPGQPGAAPVGQPDAATPGPPGPAAAGAPTANAAPGPGDADPAASDACKQFSGAMSYAAQHYEDFAYDSAGSGNVVNYDDPSVSWDNSAGRTALREAAGSAMDASSTPGLPPDISDGMQSWSLQATKLLLVMGLRGGGDTLNKTATQMNKDAHSVLLSCAKMGVHM